MPNAVFIGFTGTPLLKQDKQTSLEVFGGYIHTYKFHEAVADKVILDLKYEARDVPQRLTSPKSIEAYFAQKTKMLNNFQKAVLRMRWARQVVELMYPQRIRPQRPVPFENSVSATRPAHTR